MTTAAQVVREIPAEAYDYTLPDHWILKPDTLFAIMHEAYVARVVDIVKQSGARRVLEVGCGDGWNCGKLAESGLDVVGIDWSKNGIEHARRMVPRARFYQGDVRDDEFRRQFPQEFDAVVFVEVIEHIPPDDCIAALRNIGGSLKRGGTLVLTTPSVNKPNTNTGHYRHFTEEILRDLANRSGFVVRGIEGYGDVPAEDAYYRKARWVDNRHWLIYSARRRLLEGYRRRCSRTPLNVCHGFIMTLEKL